MIEFGDINLEDLEGHDALEYPEMVPGRVAHIDADFLAYMVTAHDDITFDQMRNNAQVAIETLRLLSGAELVQLHLTPSGSHKGFRYEIAIQKEYQGNRKDKPKPKFLNNCRTWMHKTLGAKLWLEQEADDGLAQALYLQEDPNKAVLISKDKDLLMVPGLQMSWDTGQFTDTKDDPFGWIELYTPPAREKDDGTFTKPGTKLTGRGTKFFWAQMLMGDQADNIQGVPLVPGKTKWKRCGMKAAFDLLEHLTTDAACFRLVKMMYEGAEKEGGHAYKHWQTGEPKTWKQAFKSEAALLWMRRRDDPADVLKWMMETCA